MLGQVLALFLLFVVLHRVYDWWVRRRYVDGLHKKAVFITGCDSGFGNALAKWLYKRGVPVFAGCLVQSSATKLQDETGHSLKTVIIDVTDVASIKRAVEYVKENLPNDAVFWGLVNNAGVLDYIVPMEFLDKKDYMKLLDVNLFGMIEVTKAFLPLLKRSKGRIVNMTSICTEQCVRAFTAYNISKHAAQAFSDTLRLDQAVWGIKVSTIKPAGYKTNLFPRETFSEKMHNKLKEGNPEVLKEYGEECFRKVEAMFNKETRQNVSTDFSPVVAAYEHALFSVRPRNAYYPGLQAKFFSLLPYLGSTAVAHLMDKVVKFEPKSASSLSK